MKKTVLRLRKILIDYGYPPDLTKM